MRGNRWFVLAGHVVSHDLRQANTNIVLHGQMLLGGAPLLSLSSLPRQVLRTFARWNRLSSNGARPRRVALTMKLAATLRETIDGEGQTREHRRHVSGLGRVSLGSWHVTVVGPWRRADTCTEEWSALWHKHARQDMVCFTNGFNNAAGDYRSMLSY